MATRNWASSCGECASCPRPRCGNSVTRLTVARFSAAGRWDRFCRFTRTRSRSSRRYLPSLCSEGRRGAGAFDHYAESAFFIAHNAFRHSGASSVNILLDFGAGGLRMSVRDDGVGLSEDHLKRGHGLANMRADAERLGGVLEVESIGEGTTVTCVVPYPSEQGGSQVLIEAKVTVLVVDDHAIVREWIAEALSQSGDFEMIGQAADGEEAVDLVRQLRPDMVVMDILVPIKSGIEACCPASIRIAGPHCLT